MRLNIQQIQKIENEMLKETIEILNRNEIVFYLAFGSVLGAVRHGGPIPWDSDMDILVPLSMLEKARNCLESELSDRFFIHDLNNDKKYNLVFPRVALSFKTSHTIHVDIFPLLGLPDDADKQVKISKKLDRISETLRYKQFRQYIVHHSPIKDFIGKCVELFCSPLTTRQLLKKYYNVVKDYSYETSEYLTSAGACYGVKNILRKEVYGTPVIIDYCGLKAPIPEQWEFYLRNYYKEYMNFPPESVRAKGLAFEYEIDEEDYQKVKDVIG